MRWAPYPPRAQTTAATRSSHPGRRQVGRARGVVAARCRQRAPPRTCVALAHVESPRARAPRAPPSRRPPGRHRTGGATTATRGPGRQSAAAAPARDRGGRCPARRPCGGAARPPQPRDQVPARHRHGTGGDHGVVPLGRHVVVVAVEAAFAGCPSPRANAVQLVVRLSLTRCDHSRPCARHVGRVDEHVTRAHADCGGPADGVVEQQPPRPHQPRVDVRLVPRAARPHGRADVELPHARRAPARARARRAARRRPSAARPPAGRRPARSSRLLVAGGQPAQATRRTAPRRPGQPQHLPPGPARLEGRVERPGERPRHPGELVGEMLRTPRCRPRGRRRGSRRPPLRRRPRGSSAQPDQPGELATGGRVASRRGAAAPAPAGRSPCRRRHQCGLRRQPAVDLRPSAQKQPVGPALLGAPHVARVQHGDLQQRGRDAALTAVHHGT